MLKFDYRNNYGERVHHEYEEALDYVKRVEAAEVDDEFPDESEEILLVELDGVIIYSSLGHTKENMVSGWDLYKWLLPFDKERKIYA